MAEAANVCQYCTRPAYEHNRRNVTYLDKGRKGVNVKNLDKYPKYGDKRYKDANTFIDRLTILADAEDMSVRNRVERLPLLMIKPSDSQWVQDTIGASLDEFPEMTWNDVKLAFVGHFGTAGQPDQYISMILSNAFDQKVGQSLASYYNEFCQIADKGNLNMDDPIIIGKFRQGLLQYLKDTIGTVTVNWRTDRRNVSTRPYGNIAELFDLLKTVEAQAVEQSYDDGAMNLDPTSNTRITGEESRRQHVAKTQEQNKETMRYVMGFDGEESEEDTEEGSSSKKKVKKRRSAKSPETKTPKKQQKPLIISSTSMTRATNLCLRCGGRNHRANNCRSTQRKIDAFKQLLHDNNQAHIDDAQVVYDDDDENEDDDNDNDQQRPSSIPRVRVNNVLNTADAAALPSVNQSGQKPPETLPPTVGTLKQDRDRFEGQRADPNAPTQSLRICK